VLEEGSINDLLSKESRFRTLYELQNKKREELLG
jgi:hypothetical protein